MNTAPSNGTLVTGFEPFGRSDHNVSGIATEAASLHGLNTHVLPVSFSRSFESLIEKVEAGNYRRVVMLGQGAAIRSVVSFEAVARNRSVAIFQPDNEGERKLGAIIDDAKRKIGTDVDIALKRDMEQEGIRTRISSNAGIYVCNHVFYQAVHQLNDISVSFLHLNNLSDATAHIVGELIGQRYGSNTSLL